MKKTMDKDTILYVGEDFSLAYHSSLLKNNYFIDAYTRSESEIVDRIVEKATNIYYKVNDNVNSWVKYEYAIQNYEGTHEERLEKALKNPNMILSKNLIEIPKTIYRDADNRIHTIHPNDGKNLKSYWCERIDGLLDTPKYSATRRKVTYPTSDLGEIASYAIDLLVTFNKPVNNAIITLNNFFLEYEQVSDTEVLFSNVEPFMTRDYQFNDDGRYIEDSMTDDDYICDEDGLPIPFNIKQYNFEANAYMWNDVKKVRKVKPIKIENNILTFKQKVTGNGFLTYNGLLYSYKLRNSNAISDYEIEISYDEFDPDVIQYTCFVGFQLTEFELENNTNEKLEIKKYEVKGINNILPDEVEFSKKVKDSMVVCNHLDFAYHLQDAYTVKYPMDSTNGPSEFLSSDTPVKAIFLGKGTKGYDSIGLEDETEVEDDEVVEIKRNDNTYLNDYHDILTFDAERDIFLFTNYKPMDNKVSLFINGVKYDDGIHFIFDKNSNTIAWTFTKEFGGFDLITDFSYIAVYDLSFNDNLDTIKNISKFVTDYKIMLKKIKLGML